MSARHTTVCLLGAMVLVQDGRARAQARPVEATIQAVEPVSLPDYDSYRGIERYAPTRSDYARAVDDRAFVMERVTYRSDDLRVYAYVYRPATPTPGERRPVVIFNRGSYVRDAFAPEVLMLGNRLAREGFLVVAPMLRGSGGATGRDEMGGQDLHDIQNVVGVVRELSYADPARLFLYGESRGGMMTLLAAKGGFPARAAAVYGTITDFGAFLANGTPGRAQASQIWPGFPGNEAEIVESRSALRWPERIGMPLLIMHGGSDSGVASSHAQRLASALRALDRPYELKIFAGEGHVISGRAAERDADAVRWFRRHDVR